MATFLFIDGENFKGKIRSVFKDVGKHRPVWHQYDFKGLLDKVLHGTETERAYFTLRALRSTRNVKRNQGS